MTADRTVLSAEDLRLDACIAEALGVAPPPDLGQRILDRLKARAEAGPRRRWLLGALLIAAGVLVAAGVAWLQHRARDAAAVVTPAPAFGPQDPQAAAKQVEQLVRDLELPARRPAAMAQLGRLGLAASPGLRAAITAEQQRGRPELLSALQYALFAVDPAPAMQRFGLPAGEVTLVSDYADNHVLFVDAKGDRVKVVADLLGPWDARLTPQGTLLVSEFSKSRVREIDAKGQEIWSFSELKPSYSAERLSNGNTLIADSFNGRVIEVDPARQIVWKYDKSIRPFDCERLSNGNTLIADILADRVFEVDPAGEIVWEVRKMNNVHDADRLPSGNTLITLRAASKVIEVDKDGKVVWELAGLISPNEAERLSNGNTLVGENGQVREFDRDGKQVWRMEASWAVRVRRYAGQTPPPRAQDGEAGAQLQKQVEKLVRDLELPARRDAALVELEKLGEPARPHLRTALAAEQQRGRAELLGLLQRALNVVDYAKQRFGLPAGEITLVADYSENCLVLFDAKGDRVKTFDNILGPWDASLTPQGTLLLTEFSISRVREIDGKGNTVWQFEDLKSPYSAQRLASGNTLIGDTFNGRVIEVDPKGTIVWQYDKEIRPFDCERLGNGNTLIADILKDRVFEVNGKGDIVWEVPKMNNVHDADRLSNGNTLVTLRASGKVIEVDKDGKVVWELKALVSPSDAERLPNGNTLVAENGQVREFDRDGKQVWRQKMVWAVRVKRY